MREFQFPTEGIAGRTTPKYGRRHMAINVATGFLVGVVLLIAGMTTKIIAFGVVSVLVLFVSAVGALMLLFVRSSRSDE